MVNCTFLFDLESRHVKFLHLKLGVLLIDQIRLINWTKQSHVLDSVLDQMWLCLSGVEERLIGCLRLSKDEIPRGKEEVTSNTVNLGGISQQSSGYPIKSKLSEATGLSYVKIAMCHRNHLRSE